MYEEHLRKIEAIKELVKQSLVKSGKYPDRGYISHIVSDLDTRLALFRHTDVSPGDRLDVGKMNLDLQKIKKDLEILYAILEEIAEKKYVELESFINGYLLSLEEIAERSEKEAEHQMEATTLGTDIIYFSDRAPEIEYNGTTATISIGTISCSPQADLSLSVRGTGFSQSDVTLLIDGEVISMTKEYFRAGGELSGKDYNISIDDQAVLTSGAIIPGITANSKNRYSVYGGKGKILSYHSRGYTLEQFTPDKEIWSDELTDFSFYVTNATSTKFDFSAQPERKNFGGYSIGSVEAEEYRKVAFTMPPNSCFKMETDGTIYATKESVAVAPKSLYLASYTPVRDFIVHEYIPGDKVSYNDVKIRIDNVDQDTMHIDSIAVKEAVNYN